MADIEELRAELARTRARLDDVLKDRARLDGDVRAASRVTVRAHALLDALARYREGAVAPRVVLAAEQQLQEALERPGRPAPALPLSTLPDELLRRRDRATNAGERRGYEQAAAMVREALRAPGAVAPALPGEVRAASPAPGEKERSEWDDCGTAELLDAVREDGRREVRIEYRLLVEAAKSVLLWHEKMTRHLNPPNYCPPMERLAAAVRRVRKGTGAAAQPRQSGECQSGEEEGAAGGGDA